MSDGSAERQVAFDDRLEALGSEGAAAFASGLTLTDDAPEPRRS